MASTLDTETAAAIIRSAAQCNAVAEEATRRVVELMRDTREQRDRIDELEAALHSTWSISLSLQAEIDNDGPDTSMAEINGRLVEIAEACARVVGPKPTNG